MKCAACHSEMILKSGELGLRIHGRPYFVKNVTSVKSLPPLWGKARMEGTAKHGVREPELQQRAELPFRPRA